jgi:acyl-coenzyme A thioesterase PaaI-like protein
MTVDLRIDYIAPLTPGNVALTEARAMHRGRTIGCCEATICEEGSGKLIAKGMTVFVLRPRQRW